MQKAKFANVTVVSFIVLVGLYLLYAIIFKRETYLPLGYRGILLYYVFPILLLFLLVVFLKVRLSLRVNLALFLISSLISLYVAELGLTLINKYSIIVREERLVAEKRATVNYDTRSKLEVILDLRSKGIRAYPFITPFSWLRERVTYKMPTIEIGGKKILPLGSLPDNDVVVCNENGQYVTIRHDQNGFNNPPDVWNAKQLDVATVGDSFIYGQCVDQGKDICSHIRGVYPNTLNLGMSGNGPLCELASLKDYLPPFKPKIVLWFYFEENDLGQLESEKKSEILMKYLNIDFQQGLVEKKTALKEKLIKLADKLIEIQLSSQNRKSPESQDSSQAFSSEVIQTLKLASVRSRVIDIGRRNRGKKKSQLNFNLFRLVLEDARDTVYSWGGELYFVYLPCRFRYWSKHGIEARYRDDVLSLVKSLNIPTIDIHKAFSNHPDPSHAYYSSSVINGHFSEEGQKLVAKTVLKTIRNSIVK